MRPLHHHRVTTGLAGAALVATTLVTGASTSVADDATPHVLARPSATRAQTVLDWERILFRTVYTEGLTPIPTGVPLMGFTSMAMYDAVQSSLARHHSSEKAAVAAAAHGVLSHYFASAPPLLGSLNANLLATLSGVRDGPAEDRGLRIGEAAAAEMVADRADDGYGDTRLHYSKPKKVGYWQPSGPPPGAPPGSPPDMLAAWLGSLDPLVLRTPVKVDGPDSLTSRAYARDFNEVKAVGGATSTRRSAKQTLTALFFNSNSATMIGDAVVRRLQEHPVGLRRTTRLFAVMHASMTDSVIECFRLKRDVGFWRPAEAIAQAADDGNPRTAPEEGWTTLVPSPPYADYVSGHACLTAPAVETIRQILGENTRLELVSVHSPRPRVYGRLSTIERQALNARIWSGLHFRDAMDDGYLLGHRTARRVLAQVP